MSETEPLVELLRELKARLYSFTAVTPATHARILARTLRGPPGLRDIFGWNRPFVASDLDERLVELVEAADALERQGDHLRSKVRVASLDGALFLHSAYPTDEPDAVFFGPDTYRFAAFLRQHLELLGASNHVIDLGAGSGAGGISVSRWAGCPRVTLVDVNGRALRLAQINARASEVPVQLVEADALPGGADLVIANPPYMIDAAGRTYRHGGELLGGAVALQWVEQALEGLRPGGSMLLYTGAAFVAGEAPVMQAIAAACRKAGASLQWHEIDPDVFGEELANPAYHEVERIAAIGAVITI